METFDVIRYRDVSGVSGLGTIAEGTLWWDGTATIKWFGDYPTIATYPSLEAIEAIHGHEGSTEIVFHDQQPRPRSGTASSNGRGCAQPRDASRSGGRSGSGDSSLANGVRRLRQG